MDENEQHALDDEGLNDDVQLDDGADEGVEQEDEGGQDDGRDELEAKARELGWKPKTDWKGDTSGWVDADEFLERTKPGRIRTDVDSLARENRELKRQREAEKAEFEARIARLDKVTQTALKRQREQLLANVKAAQRQAVENADTEAFDELTAYERKVAEDFAKEDEDLVPEKPAAKTEAQVDPTVKAWVDANPAIRFSGPKWQAAVAFFSEAEAENPQGSVADHLAHVEARINETWPGTVRKKANGQANGEGKPPSRGPQVEGGGRMAKTAARQKGWNDIPADERRIYKDYIKEGLFKDEADAAKAHWS